MDNLQKVPLYSDKGSSESDDDIVNSEEDEDKGEELYVQPITMVSIDTPPIHATRSQKKKLSQVGINISKSSVNSTRPGFPLGSKGRGSKGKGGKGFSRVSQ